MKKHFKQEINSKLSNKVETEFPIDIFPEYIQEYIKQSAKQFPAPVSYFSLTVLTLVSTTLNRYFRVELKEGHLEPAIIWSVLVGSPSCKKSPVIRDVLKPLFELEKERNLIFKNIQQGTALDIDENQSLKLHISTNNEGKPVKPAELILEDVTMEGLHFLESSQDRSVIIYSDEILSFIKSFNAYKKGGDKQKMLSLFNGCAVRSYRKSEGSIYASHSAISLLGSIQPDVLDELGFQTNDGFVSRFLFVVAGDYDKYLTDFSRDKDVLNEFKFKIKQLFKKIDPDYHEFPNIEKGTFKTLKLSHAAYRYLIDFHNQFLLDTTNPLLEAYLGKMYGYTARLALVLHALQNPFDEIIDHFTMNKAIQLAKYFISQYKIVLDIALGEYEFKRLSKIMEKLKRFGKKEIPIRELYRNRIGGAKNSKEGQALAKELESAGFGKILKKQNNRRSEVFSINTFH